MSRPLQNMDIEDAFKIAYTIVQGEANDVLNLIRRTPTFDPNAIMMSVNYGRRLLFYAFQVGNSEIVKAFLNHPKIDLSLPLDMIRDEKDFSKYFNFQYCGEFKTSSENTEFPQTPLYYALLFGTDEIISLLMKTGKCDITRCYETRFRGKQNALQVAVQAKMFGGINSKVDSIFKNGFKFDQVPIETIPKTLLFGFHPKNGEKCSSFNVKIMNEYLKSKIGINKSFPSDDGRTPFMIAISVGNFKIARYLRNNGANINAIDNYGRTAIFFLIELPQSFLNPKNKTEQDKEEEDNEDEEDDEEEEIYSLPNLGLYLKEFGLNEVGFDLTMMARWKKDLRMVKFLLMVSEMFSTMFHSKSHEYLKSGLIYGPEGNEQFDHELFFEYYKLLKFQSIPIVYWTKILKIVISRHDDIEIFKKLTTILKNNLSHESFLKLKESSNELLHIAVGCIASESCFYADFLMNRWNANVNHVAEGRSILMDAISSVQRGARNNSSHSMISFLLSKGVDVNYKNEHGKCIHQPELGIFPWKSFQFLESLHKSGLNLKERSGKSGKTLIGLVREIEKKDTLVEILRIFCSLNILNINNACVDGKVPISFFLLSFPVEISRIPIFNQSLVDSEGNCSLHYVMKNRKDFKNIQNYLRDNIRKIFNWRNNSDETPLMIAIKRKEEDPVPLYEICKAAILSNEMFMFEELLNELEETEPRICANFVMPRFGVGLLTELNMKGRLGYCRMLVEEFKVPIKCYWASSTGDEIITPTIVSVSHYPILKYLIDNGGSLHESYVDAISLFMHLFPHPKLINNLLKVGYNVHLELDNILATIKSHQIHNVNYIDESTKDYALPSLNEGALDFLSHQNVLSILDKKHLSGLLPYRSNSEEKRKLLDLGADPLCVIDVFGNTALHFAAMKGLSVKNWLLFREYGVTAAKICEIKNPAGFTTLEICKAEGTTENLFIAYPNLRILIKHQTLKYSNLSESETTGDFKTCGICREDYTKNDDISLLKCKHILHLSCLIRLNDENFNSCPYCRHTKFKL